MFIGVLLIVAVALHVQPTVGTPLHKLHNGVERTKRFAVHLIEDCIYLTSEGGHFFYKTVSEDSTVCGIYLIAEPNQAIEIVFDYLDVPCSSGGLVGVVDGWEMNGGFFPAVSEHRLPLDERVSEFCGLTPPSRTFISSQNAALIQYRVPKKGQGFSFRVNYVKHPKPCHVMIDDSLENVYTLRNYGRATNCSLMAVYPIHATVLSLNVGITLSGTNFKVETGTLNKCEESGLKDYMEISGGTDLPYPRLIQGDTLCGMDSYPEGITETIMCGVSTIRLVSSGDYDNSVTLAIWKAEAEDKVSATSIVCP